MGRAISKVAKDKLLGKIKRSTLDKTANATKRAFQALNKHEVRNLPKNPNDLLMRGYREISHPLEREAGHRTFQNPVTKATIRFDPAKPGKSGHGAKDHYHYNNPKRDEDGKDYLDINGDPCLRNSNESHIYPRD